MFIDGCETVGNQRKTTGELPGSDRH
jgi:hypothetical protein